MLEQNLSAPESVRIVTTGAENLLDSQRETIRKAFECEVREHYGLAESVANISECEHGRLHVDEDFSHVEFIPVDSEANQYRIVGTNWSNPAFPLFRYDTGDIATLSDEEECPCGRMGRIVERIEGRREDYVVISSGARIGRLDHIFKDMVTVRSAQIYQPDRSRVVLRIVKGKGYTQESEKRVLREARKRLGDKIEIEVEYRDEIPTTASGKLKFVVSDIESMQLPEETGVS
jgi:phenylacetate-CoA ligase